jgi:ABC-type multidrug transport system fused ATPase/permease subunit
MVGGWSFADAFFNPAFRGGPSMVGLIMTLLLFFAVVYVERTRLEFSIVYRKFDQITGKCSIKFLYLSVIPLLLVMTVFANIRIVAYLTGAHWLVYYTDPPTGLVDVVADPLRTGIYTILLMGLTVAFAWLWLCATGMGPRYLSEQFDRLGMSLIDSDPNPEVAGWELARQATAFALLGAVLVSGFSILAGTTWVFVGAIGLILTVGILRQLYAEISAEHVKNKKQEVCPVCGSGSFIYSGTFGGWTFPGIHTGQSYACKNCGYVGSIVLELKAENIEKIRNQWAREAIDGAKYSQLIFPDKWIWFWRIMALVFVFLLLFQIFSVIFLILPVIFPFPAY